MNGDDAFEAKVNEHLELIRASIAPYFSRVEPREHALAYIRGLLGPSGRKTGRRLAADAGDRRPDGMQRLLVSARWDPDLVRDELCNVVARQFGRFDSVLVLAAYEFLKKGSYSAGVERQFSGRTRRMENCQAAIFAVYDSAGSQFILDRRLYLPRSWFANDSRRRSAGIPPKLSHREKWQLGQSIIRSLQSARLPFRWIAAEAAELIPPHLRSKLEWAGLPYLVALSPGEASSYVRRLLADSAARPGVYHRPHALGRGCSCQICGSALRAPLYWLRVPLPVSAAPHTERCLLLRCHSATGRIRQGYLCASPRGASVQELTNVARRVRRGRNCVDLACKEVGLGSYEVRTWTAWHRHMTLAAVAHYCLNAAIADLDTRQLADQSV